MKGLTKGLLLALLLVGSLAPVLANPAATTNTTKVVAAPPITRLSDLTSVGGFGDRLNSYAWCMGVFDGDLYVGTGRFQTTFHPMWEQIWRGMNLGGPPVHLPGTPDMPFLQDWMTVNASRHTAVKEVSGVPVPAFAQWDDTAAAQIWCFNHHSRKWKCVFTSPYVKSSLEDMAGNKPYKIPAALGFRKMDVFKDRYGLSAIFAFVGGLTYSDPSEGTLIYQSLNGRKWVSVPTPEGMGSQTRASTVHNRKLYVGAKTSTGISVWCTDTARPYKTDWKLVLDMSTDVKYAGNSDIISLASFNGKLYVGTENGNGFQVWCGSGRPGVNDWVNVIRDGGIDKFNVWAATMKEFNGQLMVGSIGLPFVSGQSAFKGCDIFSISTTNKWKLLVGGGTPVRPVAGYENVRSISGWPSGFGNPMNFYCWSFEVYNNKLYAGTFDASTFLRYLKDYTGPVPDALKGVPIELLPYLATGADLWETQDGRNWRPRTINGCGNMNNYGVRIMSVFENNLILGLNNPWEGCEIRTLNNPTQR